MSKTRSEFDFEKIDSIMSEGDVAGMAFASVDHEGKIIARERGFKRYNLELMIAGDKTERKPECYYVNPTSNGFEYEVIGVNKELIKAFIPWKDLPKDIPHDDTAITEKKYLTLPAIQKWAQGSGHVQSVTSESVFRAASLSKPVFAYLVLKLIEDNKSNEAKVGLGKFKLHKYKYLKEFNLDTPLWKDFPEMLRKFTDDKETQGRAKELTARHVLSHTTGLPLRSFIEGEKLKFQFKPGTEYGYSNHGITLLQETVDFLTGSNLHALAKANIFDDPKMGMKNSSFLDPALLSDTVSDKVKLSEMHAANSLHTTATDYAGFISGWLQNDKLRDIAFTKQIDMKNDKWAVGQGLSDEDRKKVGWGLGIGLQLDSQGKTVIGAFHPGDMDQWRAFVAIDIHKKEGIVYFSNSPNGLLLVDTIIKPNVEINDGLKYVFEKYGFARIIEDDWKNKQTERVTAIIAKYELHLAMNENKDKFTVSMKCDPYFFNTFVDMFKNQLEEFKKNNNMKENDCIFDSISDKNKNIISLTIGFQSIEKYNQFSKQLKEANLTPPSATSELSTPAKIFKGIGATATTRDLSARDESTKEKKNSEKIDTQTSSQSSLPEPTTAVKSIHETPTLRRKK